jgi:HAE1 family hydrophobic/amphiphilic exporter-1
VVYTEDNTLEISDGMGVLANSLLLSVVLVMALLFFFLGNRGWKLGAVVGALAVGALLVILTVDEGLPRAAAIGLLGVVILLTCRAAVLSVSGIVFAFLGALLIFWLTGYSLNEITLLSFVLVSGIIVDDAIVVLENIQRHREEGKPLLEAVVDGTSEVFWPVVSATLTTMAAFLPMLLMTGTVGDFFSMVPIAVATALAISLVECLIILPLHVVEAEKVLGRDPSLDRSHTHETGELPTTGVLGLVARVYDRLLRFNLRHPIIAIGSASLLFFMAVGVIVWSAVAPTMGYKPILKSEFFPEDLSVLMLRVKAPPGTPLDQTDATVRAISERLDARGRGEIWTVSGLSGLSLDTNYQLEFSNQRGTAMIKLPPRAERTFDQPRAFLRQLRADIESEFELEGWAIELSPAPSGPPVGLPVNVRITGVDEEQIVRLSSDLQAWMESEVVEGGKLAGVIDLGNDRSAVNGVLTFMPDRRRAALNEVSEDQVSRFVASAFDGAFVGDFRRPDGDIPVRVRLPEDLVASHEGFLSVPLVLDPNGRTLSFGDIGQMQSSIEPADLIRRDFQRTVTITGDLSEDSLLSAGTITPIISAWYKERAADYPGATIAFGGEAESTAKSYQSLMIAFLLSVIIIYGILAAQFRSYLQPFLIMSNIVFSFTGVVLFMALMGLGAQYLPAGWIQPERALFTVNSFIAIVGLTGLVINDAIVLIDFINKRRREGMPLEQALITAGHQRMRPIALTTATTIAGLLPMAIGIPEFSITWGPFATSFAAGLAVATVMTLLIVPVLYQTLDRTVSFGRRHLSTVVPALRDDPTSEIERAA